MRVVDDLRSQNPGEVTLVLGGAGSGKSVFAEGLIGSSGRDVVYLATLSPSDDECRRRIYDHQERRPAHWSTIELNGDLGAVAGRLPLGADVLFDSLTCYVSLLPSGGEMSGPDVRVPQTISTWREEARTVVVVSDEIGSGVVPVNSEARRFRDTLGKLNQVVAGIADKVYLVVAGIPVRVK